MTPRYVLPEIKVSVNFYVRVTLINCNYKLATGEKFAQKPRKVFCEQSIFFPFAIPFTIITSDWIIGLNGNGKTYRG